LTFGDEGASSLRKRVKRRAAMIINLAHRTWVCKKWEPDRQDYTRDPVLTQSHCSRLAHVAGFTCLIEDGVGENLVPKGGTNTTVLFSSEGARTK
jgi:hypothetical protein